MMTKAILSAAAFCVLTLAQAQEGTTPASRISTAKPADVQDPLTPQKSVYHTCLVSAGAETWKALGLDVQQADRVADLQARYKNSLNPPKEEKVKGKKTNATAEKTAKATAAEPVSTQVSTGAEKEMFEPLKQDQATQGSVEATSPEEKQEQAAQGSVEATSPDVMPTISTIDDELRSILTPEQLALWEKKCSVSEPTGALVPQE